MILSGLHVVEDISALRIGLGRGYERSIFVVEFYLRIPKGLSGIGSAPYRPTQRVLPGLHISSGIHPDTLGRALQNALAGGPIQHHRLHLVGARRKVEG